jgi:hypothetical protein
MPVYRSPQPMLYPGDLEHDLIQMPLVARPRKATTDLIGELLAEFARPLPHGFVADDDAAGSEQLLHHAETKREAEIEPYGVADNLGRKPIAGIAEASERRHPTRLPVLVCQRKPGPEVDGASHGLSTGTGPVDSPPLALRWSIVMQRKSFLNAIALKTAVGQ